MAVLIAHRRSVRVSYCFAKGLATDSDTLVDSLNVSVASAILLYELLHH